MVNWNGCDTEEEIIIWEEGENARRGGKAHGETAKVWKNMINSHQHVFDLTRRKSGIHARYKRIQKEQDDVKYLLTKEPRGTFTWDNAQSRVTASNAAWNKLKNSNHEKAYWKLKDKTLQWLRPIDIQIEPPSPSSPCANRSGFDQANPFGPGSTIQTPRPNNPFRQDVGPQLIYPAGGSSPIQRRRSSPPFAASRVQASPAQAAQKVHQVAQPPGPAPAQIPAHPSLATLSLQANEENEAKHGRVLDLLETERKWLKRHGEMRAEHLFRSDVMFRNTCLRYADYEDRRKA